MMAVYSDDGNILYVWVKIPFPAKFRLIENIEHEWNWYRKSYLLAEEQGYGSCCSIVVCYYVTKCHWLPCNETIPKTVETEEVKQCQLKRNFCNMTSMSVHNDLDYSSNGASHNGWDETQTPKSETKTHNYSVIFLWKSLPIGSIQNKMHNWLKKQKISVETHNWNFPSWKHLCFLCTWLCTLKNEWINITNSYRHDKIIINNII